MKKMGKRILKIVIMVVCALLIFFIGVGLGSGGSDDQSGQDGKVEAVSVSKQLDSKKSDLKKVKSDLSQAKQKLADQKAENKKVFAMIDKKDEIQKQINSKQDELKSVNSKLDDSKKKLDEQQGKLKNIQHQITLASGELQKAKKEPIKLSAGEYVVGVDVAKGHYKATNIGRGRNFFVYDSEGNPIVNTILGDSEIGTGDYVFFCDEGWIIKTEAPVKLIPLK